MVDDILFPTDGGDLADPVLEYAIDAALAHDATLHVLHVADTTRDSVTRVSGRVIDVLEREGERIVEAAADRAGERGVSTVREVLQGRPAETIVDYAERYGVDLVVVPTHGRGGLERFLLGSVTERVLDEATVPVVTIRPDEGGIPPYPPGDVLVPTDGSEGAALARAAAIDLASETGAGLHFLHVVETASLGPDVRSAISGDDLEERAEGILADAREAATAAAVEPVADAVARGRPYREVLDYVDEHGVDLVVLGATGETDFGRYRLGGVTAKLVRTSPVPVMVVRASPAEE